MRLVNKSILIISPEPWDHIFVSKHHYAVNLANKGNMVFFLNPPSYKKSKITNSEYRNLRILNYDGFIAGIRYFPAFLQRYFMRKKYEELEEISGVSFDIVWSFDNSVLFDFNALPNTVFKISHIVDLNQDFNTRKAASTASICIGVIPEIVKRLSKYNLQTILVRHGVNFTEAENGQISLPGENQFKALYSGNMDMPHIDWNILERLVEEFNEVDFIFLGSMSSENSNLDTLLEQNNVFYIPPVSSDKVPKYLNSADILLVAYNKKYYSNYASPHKMLEYLASGKMIITTWTKEYIELYEKGLLSMNESTDEYIASFKGMLSRSSFNDKEKIEARKTYAINNTYDKQIDRIENYLAELLTK